MKEYVYTSDDLVEMQSFPLDRKIQIAQTRILEWNLKTQQRVFVSFSGGKDSTVLLDLVRMVNKDCPAVFVNTGLEFPEIRKFALSKDNCLELRPEMTFNNVIKSYGYPLISKEVSQIICGARANDRGLNQKHKLIGDFEYQDKNGNQIKSNFNVKKYLQLSYLPIRISSKCCNVMKERPVRRWQQKQNLLPFIGTMADESKRRRQAWLKLGCNAFNCENPRSLPLSIWTEQDVLKYIVDYNIEICSVYGDIVPFFGKDKTAKPILKCTGCQRTGCVFCLYGAHIREFKENRFQKLAYTHPKLYDYCMRGGAWIDNPDYDPSMPKWNQQIPTWLNWNPKKIWVPTENGLGYKVMLDMVNSIYGKDFIAYD